MIQIGIVSYPFHLNNDGRRDLILRPKDAPKVTTVPLYDHHELGEPPIGIVHLEHTIITNLNGQNLAFVCGQVMTKKGLPMRAGLSISAPLLSSIGEYDILGDIVEVSVVDKPSLSACRIYDVDELIPAITALYMGAPNLVDRLRTDLVPQTV